GLYLLKRETIELIPPNKHFNMTDLINKLKRKKKKILTYVIQEDQFVDLGELEQYKDFINTLLRNTL
ncbi:MAG: hypothetical protein N2169_03580, partial [bacterium]|nr:hypothetical protein [bacterium]